MSSPRSLVAGPNAAQRRMIAAAAAPTAAPTLATQGQPFKGGDWLHVYAAFNAGAGTCTIVPYFWSAVAERWYAGDAMSLTAAADTWALTEIRGEARVYLRLTAIDAGNIDAWAARSYDGLGDGSGSQI